MNGVLSFGALSLTSLAVSVVTLVVGLVLWFFVNRVSSRTNEQIELLEALLNQQKRQNALFRHLCETSEPEEAAGSAAVTAKDENDDVVRLIVER